MKAYEKAGRGLANERNDKGRSTKAREGALGGGRGLKTIPPKPHTTKKQNTENCLDLAKQAVLEGDYKGDKAKKERWNGRE